MEDMFSLGSVILWNNIQCGTDGATDGEIAELFGDIVVEKAKRKRA